MGPNLLVFGLFTFLPIVINFVYAITGGVKLMPFDRPFTGMENFGILFECRDYFDIHDLPQGRLLARHLQHRALQPDPGRADGRCSR